ncbi:MAG TPA: GTP-binding protein, partial [Clostridiaceae bacterium]|nr:GTP-binding protein [Clostridiaceae bacterium]
MNILVISGFLGAGKTSFIKAMAKACERQFVVVENEFGEMNLDGPMLAQEEIATMSKEEALNKMEVWELTEGCICCSMNMDFSQSVLTIANALDPDYLLVEPSGVARPSRIIDHLRRIQYDRIRLLKPVTIIDAENYISNRRDFKDHFLDQINSAGTIVLSKSEQLDREDMLRIKEDLTVPEKCQFPLCHYSSWPKEKWYGLLDNYDESFIERFSELIDAERRESDAATDLGHGVDDTNLDAMEHMGFTSITCLNPADLISKLH